MANHGKGPALHGGGAGKWDMKDVVAPWVGRGGALVETMTFKFQPEGREFDSRSNRHVGTLGKSFTCRRLCASS